MSGASITFSNAVRWGKSWNPGRSCQSRGGPGGRRAGVMAAVGSSVCAADADLAVVEGVQAVDAPQQRRLAGAAGADQGHRLAGLDPSG